MNVSSLYSSSESSWAELVIVVVSVVAIFLFLFLDPTSSFDFTYRKGIEERGLREIVLFDRESFYTVERLNLCFGERGAKCDDVHRSHQPNKKGFWGIVFFGVGDVYRKHVEKENRRTVWETQSEGCVGVVSRDSD